MTGQNKHDDLRRKAQEEQARADCFQNMPAGWAAAYLRLIAEGVPADTAERFVLKFIESSFVGAAATELFKKRMEDQDRNMG